MNEPKRLCEESESDWERMLLGAGRASAPGAARQRAVAAACAVAATGLASGSAGAGGAVTKAGATAGLKWLAVVGVVGLGAASVAVVMPRRAEERAPEVATPTGGAAARGGETVGLGTAAGFAPPPAPAPTNRSTPPAPIASASPTPHASLPAVVPTTTPPSASTLPDEIAMLERARGAMAAGDPARALGVLDAYAERFPQPSLLPEATVVRIEALMKAGDPSAARRAADAFLAANPGSPYADRIRTLLGGSNH